MTRGETLDDLRVERNVEMGLGVVVCRARRWTVQSGILLDVSKNGIWLCN